MGRQAGEIKADVIGLPPQRPVERLLRLAGEHAAAKGTLESIAASDLPSVSEKGSLLIFPKIELRWDWCGNLTQDVYLTLNNDYPGPVQVQMYFVNGDLPEPAMLPRCVGP
jgi:hypothetical protein